MFLANENFPKPSINYLRSKGIDVKSIQESSPGISDAEVMAMAKMTGKIILTFDRDYGELIFRYAAESPCAVIYFRYKGADPIYAGQLLFELVSSGNFEFRNSFTVIDKNSVRQRSFEK